MNLFTDIILFVNEQNRNNPLFMINFNILVLKNNKITQSEFINYKYFILKNFLFAPNIKDNIKEDAIDVFSKAQKIYFTLCKFMNIVKLKYTKHIDNPVDLHFNDIHVIDNKYIITLINSDTVYKFYICDLIKIINTSLSYEYKFFPEPTNIKNPWNNKPFTCSNLYNIYFFIKNLDNINMSILFERFFQSNFCLKHFVDHNQFIIKNYIINNCHLLCHSDKMTHISSMITTYNSHSATKNQFFIDIDYPNHNLVKAFDKYLKIYLLSNYSYESDIRMTSTFKLNKQLRLFKGENIISGRKISFKNIIKLYFISKLHYDENVGIYYNGYVPTPDMITLEHKAFFIDFVSNNSKYSIFPHYRYNKPIQIIDNNDISNLSTFVNTFTFNDSHIEVIKLKKYNELINTRDFNIFMSNNIINISRIFIKLQGSSRKRKNQISDYTNTNQISDYTNTNQISDYTNTNQISDYTNTNQISDYTNTNQISDYTNTNQISDYTNTNQISDYTNTNQISDYSYDGIEENNYNYDFDSYYNYRYRYDSVAYHLTNDDYNTEHNNDNEIDNESDNESG